MKSARALLPLELELPEELLAPLEELPLPLLLLLLLVLLVPLLDEALEAELADEPLELPVPPDEKEDPPPQAARQARTDRAPTQQTARRMALLA
jgi:hypothetical protein